MIGPPQKIGVNLTLEAKYCLWVNGYYSHTNKEKIDEYRQWNFKNRRKSKDKETTEWLETDNTVWISGEWGPKTHLQLMLIAIREKRTKQGSSRLLLQVRKAETESEKRGRVGRERCFPYHCFSCCSMFLSIMREALKTRAESKVTSTTLPPARSWVRHQAHN